MKAKLNYQTAAAAALVTSLVLAAATGCERYAAAQPSSEPIGRQAADAAAPKAASMAGAILRYSPPPASRAFESWSLRETTVDSLARIGSPAVPELRRWLADTNPEVRRQAADLIGRIGPDAAGAIPDLIILLDDESPLVRKHAARALGQIGPRAAESTPALLRVLREEILKEQIQNDVTQ